MEKINPDIRKNYARYKEILEGRKTTQITPITLTKTKKGHNTLLGKDSVTYAGQKDSAQLAVEVSSINHKTFKFRLSAKELSDEPIFRFDSSGPPHCNSHLSIRLPERKVDTPHFHRYSNTGHSEAYKTEQLKDEKTAKALEDVNLCMAHFCHESNTRLENEEFPEVKIDSNGVLFHVTDEDPLNNISFA